MKNYFSWLFSPEAKDYSDNTGYIYKRIISWIAGLTLLILILLLIFLNKCNTLNGVITFLSVAGASVAGGAAIGFLFGLPRSEKYRFIKKDDTDHNARDYAYADNTNLEEVSDWLSKIIVGLTLVKLNTIISWLNLSAHSIDNAFSKGCDMHSLNFYVFGYCIIILYFLAGGGLCYLWARTNLSLIFTRSKKAQEELEKKQLIAQVQSYANPDLNAADGVVVNIARDLQEKGKGASSYPTDKFKNMVESVYNAKTVKDKTDLQKGRWGGAAKTGDRILEASYDANSSFMGLYKVNLTVRSLNADNPLKGEVAFFLHDTFPSEIVYSVSENNLSKISIVAWEAFVAGAKLEDGTELELDLNAVKGFPDGFYWKE